MTALTTYNPPTKTAFRPFNLVAFGASAGGLDPLKSVLRRLPPTFPIPIVVVQHLSATYPSKLPEILSYNSCLACRWADDGDVLMAGRILVARAGANLVLDGNRRLRSVSSPRSRMGWPSVDVFFQSMAKELGPSAIGVVLSGMMQDGASGTTAIRRAGGATMVQHPSLAECPDMPNAAVDLGRADLALTPAQIADALIILGQNGVR